jgi:hypothetical protein
MSKILHSTQQYIYVFCMDFNKTAIMSPYNTSELIFITDTKCVFPISASRSVIGNIYIAAKSAFSLVMSVSLSVHVYQTDFYKNMLKE